MTKLSNLFVISALFGVAAAGCAAQEPGEEIPDYDQQTLAEYRAIIPSAGQLEAAGPEASSSSALGDPALYPTSSWDIVTGINGSVTGIVELMRAIVDQPPSVYNSDTEEFFWGPFPNEDGIGYVGAYIRKADEDDDFEYHYALVRGIDNDVANMTPVIWGGATPDPQNEDYGTGVTMWDFEANYEFEQANNPDVDTLALDRGRFVALYAQGPDENAPENEVSFVVSAFRDFVPQDEPDAEPADLDYFYGRYNTAEFTVDFLDWHADLDVSPQPDGLAETVGVRMAFLNEGTGRAEADAIGGSLEDGEMANVVECWDTSINQTYISFETTGGSEPVSFSNGELSSCGLFQQTLDELQIPALEDVDPELLAALDEVATTGIPAE